jgi:hypothetical protein
MAWFETTGGGVEGWTKQRVEPVTATTFLGRRRSEKLLLKTASEAAAPARLTEETKGEPKTAAKNHAAGKMIGGLGEELAASRS